jgi:Polyketide synthase modules and related proteins
MSRRVVIVDYCSDYPNKDEGRPGWNAEEQERIWQSRKEELNRTYNTDFTNVGSFPGIFYPSVEQRFQLSHIPQEKSRYLLSSERITLSLFQSLIDRNTIREKSELLLSLGSSQTDVLSKSLYFALGPEQMAQAFELLDPLSFLKLLQLPRPAAIELISEASTSGAGALYSAYHKIKDGYVDVVLAGGASAMTTPIPVELSHFGIGPDRQTLPFQENASGHYFSEGGVAFLLKERELAIADGDSIIAEIRDLTAGTMGSTVYNRNAMKKLVVQSLRNAAVGEDEAVLFDLYGRGNEIDDTAEFSCLRNVQKQYPALKGTYLKEESHYVVGYYGMIGLCRLLEARQEERPLQGSTISHPNKFISSVSEQQWTTDTAGYNIISIPVFSMHGNSYNLVLDLQPSTVSSERVMNAVGGR